MKHFASDYEIDEAIARYEGLPYLAKSCNCWDGYERVPGTKPCAPGSCRKCDEGCHKKKSSQGDKPSPNAAKAVLEALVAGDEDAALDLLGETDCPEGCDTHPEGKCNHQYMAAGRTRIRYLIDNQAFKKADEKPKEFGTTHYDSPKEAGFLQDVVQMGPDLVQSIPHVLNELNPAGSGAVGTFLNHLNPAGDGLVGQGVGEVGEFIHQMTDETKSQQFMLDVSEYKSAYGQYMRNPTPEGYDRLEKMHDGFQSFWHSRGVENPAQYIGGLPAQQHTGASNTLDKESAFGFGIAKRLLKMLVGGQCPVCEGTGKLMKIMNCPACEGSGQAEVFKSKVGEFSQNQLPEIVDQFKSQIDDQAQIPDDPFALRPSAPAPSIPAPSPPPFSVTSPPRDDPFA